MAFDDLTGDYSVDFSVPDVSTPPFNSDILVEGDGSANFPPVISDPPQSSIGSILNSAQKILGSASELGTAAGTIQRQVSTFGSQFNKAKATAASGNSIGTFWQYATPTDKIVIVLAAVGVLIALIQLEK